MDELQFQSAIIKSVKGSGSGGMAFKSSNRFLIGVPDLYVSIPRCGTGFVECKIGDMPAKSDYVSIGVSPAQGAFMRKLRKANTIVGVMSALRTKKGLYVAIFDPEDLAAFMWKASTSAYVPVSKDVLYLVIRDYFNSHRI